MNKVVTDVAVGGMAARLGDFVASLGPGTIPDRIAARVADCWLNALGVGLASLATPYAQVAQKAASHLSGLRGDCTILASGAKISPSAAAFANAVLLHGRTQEDTLGGTHIGCVVVPVLLALSQSGAARPERMNAALLAAYEVGGLLDAACGRISTGRGNRSTPLYAPVAAAAAAAYAMDLPAERVGAAIALAAGGAGGGGQSFVDGSDDWRYQAGLSAQLALSAVELSAAGAVAAPNALEGHYGLIRAACGSVPEPDFDRLGQDWAIERVAFKAYPVCAYAQSACKAAASLSITRTVARNVASIGIFMNPFEYGLPGIPSPGPFSGMTEAIMSVPFAVAATLIDGAPNMGNLTAGGCDELRDLIRKIQVHPDEAVAPMNCRMYLKTADGPTLFAEAGPNPQEFDLASSLERALRDVSAPAGTLGRLDKALRRQQPDLSAVERVFEEVRSAAMFVHC
ncbi:MmgE/PrpD family protein [Thalassovita aquimarina]|uniref:MmgE/PrpD family protein n=1 Tax=Thalassovita aquimarina TaxID=2785917 RepID=A0ABS5HRG7_9RHOB|nr:MmgE/PrpD family protein [Thalassovita aquimarina]MBR9651518.1 MmgE/PrpD family protein [Thalassovita aquimarina]